jgi:hypothetical protein
MYFTQGKRTDFSVVIKSRGKPPNHGQFGPAAVAVAVAQSHRPQG